MTSASDRMNRGLRFRWYSERSPKPLLLCFIACSLVSGFEPARLMLARPVTAELVSNEPSVGIPELGPAGIPASPMFATGSSSASPFPADTEIFSSATKATGSVIFIVGLILVAAFLLKRHMPQRFGALASQRQIEVLETVALGERQTLTLVRVGKANLLLARTPSSVTLLERVELLPEGSEVAGESLTEEPAIPIDSFVSRFISSGKGLRCKVQVWLASSGKRLGATIGNLRGASRQSWATHKLKMPRTVSIGKAATFDEVMQAELNGPPSSNADESGQLLSRLSEIRSQLQARS